MLLLTRKKAKRVSELKSLGLVSCEFQVRSELERIVLLTRGSTEDINGS